MPRVDSCPKTKAEVESGQLKLHCGLDKYGNSQYMCIPNKEKSSLVEFCYDGIMGIQEKGNCLEVSEVDYRLNRTSCGEFSSGCPKEDFYNHNVFEYPACQSINTIDRCYTSTPSCPMQIMDPPENNQIPKDYTLIYISFIVFLLLIVIAIIACFIWRQRKRGSNDRTARTDANDTAREQLLLQKTGNTKDTAREQLLLQKTGNIKARCQLKKIMDFPDRGDATLQTGSNHSSSVYGCCCQCSWSCSSKNAKPNHNSQAEIDEEQKAEECQREQTLGESRHTTGFFEDEDSIYANSEGRPTTGFFEDEDSIYANTEAEIDEEQKTEECRRDQTLGERPPTTGSLEETDSTYPNPEGPPTTGSLEETDSTYPNPEGSHQ